MTTRQDNGPVKSETAQDKAHTASLLEETINRIFTPAASAAEHSALDRERPWTESVWKTLVEAGLTLLGVPEQQGGSGGSLSDAAQLVRLSAYHGTPLPLAETAMLAAWLLAEAHLPVPPEPLTLPSRQGELLATRHHRTWTVTGEIGSVPWARESTVVILAHSTDGPVVATLPAAAGRVTEQPRLADEPRDRIVLNNAPVAEVAMVSPEIETALWRRGGLARSLQLAGASQRVLEMTIRHANERVQFGRPIGRFQAVQQLVAVAAGETLAAHVAAESAVTTVEHSGICSTAGHRAVAAAKIRAGQAAGVIVATAHQVHGALGLTDEHQLHHWTRRMLQWRDEWGTETDWASVLGASVLEAGPTQLWPNILDGSGVSPPAETGRHLTSDDGVTTRGRDPG